jgi:hypothetical protein
MEILKTIGKGFLIIISIIGFLLLCDYFFYIFITLFIILALVGFSYALGELWEDRQKK